MADTLPPMPPLASSFRPSTFVDDATPRTFSMDAPPVWTQRRPMPSYGLPSSLGAMFGHRASNPPPWPHAAYIRPDPYDVFDPPPAYDVGTTYVYHGGFARRDGLFRTILTTAMLGLFILLISWPLWVTAVVA